MVPNLFLTFLIFWWGEGVVFFIYILHLIFFRRKTAKCYPLRCFSGTWSSRTLPKIHVRDFATKRRLKLCPWMVNLHSINILWVVFQVRNPLLLNPTSVTSREGKIWGFWGSQSIGISWNLIILELQITLKMKENDAKDRKKTTKFSPAAGLVRDLGARLKSV